MIRSIVCKVDIEDMGVEMVFHNIGAHIVFEGLKDSNIDLPWGILEFIWIFSKVV
jgi:hypothetical protein